MNSLPSISHRLFVAALGRPKSDPENRARRDPATGNAGRSDPAENRFPAPNESNPSPDIRIQQWVQPPASSGI